MSFFYECPIFPFHSPFSTLVCQNVAFVAFPMWIMPSENSSATLFPILPMSSKRKEEDEARAENASGIFRAENWHVASACHLQENFSLSQSNFSPPKFENWPLQQFVLALPTNTLRISRFRGLLGTVSRIFLTLRTKEQIHNYLFSIIYKTKQRHVRSPSRRVPSPATQVDLGPRQESLAGRVPLEPHQERRPLHLRRLPGQGAQGGGPHQPQRVTKKKSSLYID